MLNVMYIVYPQYILG